VIDAPLLDYEKYEEAKKPPATKKPSRVGGLITRDVAVVSQKQQEPVKQSGF